MDQVLRELFKEPLILTSSKGLGAVGGYLLAIAPVGWENVEFFVRLLASGIGAISTLLFTLSLLIDVYHKIEKIYRRSKKLSAIQYYRESPAPDDFDSGADRVYLEEPSESVLGEEVAADNSAEELPD